MARGKKYDERIKERARAYLAVCDNAAEVADKLKLPYSTVKEWRRKWLKEGGELKRDTPSLAELRRKNKEKFVDEAWGLINGSISVVKRKVSRAARYEEALDRLAEIIENHADAIERESGEPFSELAALVKELRGLNGLRLGELSSLIGIMYDKQALVNKEPTEMLELKRFEDFN